jgi:endonuclease/exonuclease/phosphatase family metal-dependent hydrolase
LFELVRAIRSRPAAFDGGASSVATPDVIIFQELRFSNLEIFDRILDQRSASEYDIVSVDGAHTRMLINTSTITLASEPQVITDPCRDGTTGESAKRYLWARFTENATGAPFVVVGVHFKAKYEETGQERCQERNIDAIRAAITAETAPVIIGGDFNKRAMEMTRECDPDEQSTPLEWWSSLTAPTDGSRAFADAVQTHHRATGDVMTHEWTFERSSAVVFCDGNMGIKRTRLDYIFAADAAVADAHADHPGWAGETPGDPDVHNPHYSDHRFVWGRFVISGPPEPLAPTAIPATGGVINLTWQLQEGVAEWVLYRAAAARDYVPIARLTPETTTYSDTGTRHGVSYRYALAPIGVDGGQGVESKPGFAVADAQGPLVIGRRPPDGSSEARRWIPIDVFFNEAIDPESVRAATIALYRKGRRVPGNLTQVSARRLRFNPYNNLRRDTHYRVVVRPTRDNLGNVGFRDDFSFRTK